MVIWFPVPLKSFFLYLFRKHPHFIFMGKINQFLMYYLIFVLIELYNI